MKPRRSRPALGMFAWLPAALLLLLPTPARAQSTTFYLDRLQIAGAPDDGIGVWRPRIGPSRVFGQLALGYSLNPLRVASVVDDVEKAAALAGPPVDHQLTTYVTAGAELLERVSLQVTLPVVVSQGGSPTDDAAAGLHQAVSLAPAAPSDLRVDGRVLLAGGETGALRLAGRAAVFLPVGDERSFTGNTGTWANVGLGAELDLGSLSIALNGGASLRPRATLHQLTVGSELTYGLGAYLPLWQGRLRLGAELFGSVGLLPETAGELDASPLEWSLSGRLFPSTRRTVWVGLGAGTRLTDGYAPDFRLVALAGGALTFGSDAAEGGAGRGGIPAPGETDTDRDGVADLVDACPVEAEDHHAPEPDDGCPDRDTDGIPDADDRCPDAAEDLDGIDDRDGCAEEDADADGVADGIDQCPKEPGAGGDGASATATATATATGNGGGGAAVEKIGCPQFIRRVTGDTAIQLMKEIDFAKDMSTIEPASFPILDEVVRLLQANPDIQAVRVEGHTDNSGAPEYNRSLSEARASAVRDYLVKHGIAAARVTSRGFGVSRPLTSNDTPEGRAKNRRVEIHLDSAPILKER